MRCAKGSSTAQLVQHRISLCRSLWTVWAGAMTIYYEASSLQGWLGLPRLMLSWRGTVWSSSLSSPVFWLVQLTHVALLILVGKLPILVSSDPQEDSSVLLPYFSCEDTGQVCVMLPALPWSWATIALGLLFFFVVFYSNNCFTRFFTLYGHCVGLGATTQEWVALVKYYSRPLAAERLPLSAVRRVQWNCTRFVLAAMHCLYYALQGESISNAEWRMLLARDLLSADEAARLRSYGGFKPFLCLCWGIDEAHELIQHASRVDASRHHDLGHSIRDELVLAQFREAAFKFRGHCGQIVNLLKQPVSLIRASHARMHACTHARMHACTHARTQQWVPPTHTPRLHTKAHVG